MNSAVQLLMNHGVAGLFVTVLADQAGLPAPAVPLMFVLGSLARPAHLDIVTSIAVAMVACLLADLFWYQVGRQTLIKRLRGHGVTLQGSESCMRHKIAAAFNRNADGVLLLAKFIPGPNLVSPLAGLSGVKPLRFLIVDALASILWAGSFLTFGYCFAQRIQACCFHI